MLSAVPAVFFLAMLIAPCAMALMGDRRKSKEAPADPAPEKTKEAAPAKIETKPSSASVPVFTPPQPAETRAPRSSRRSPLDRDPYEEAALLYAQPKSSFLQSVLPAAAEQPAATANADLDKAETLLAQAAAAKAKAAALAAAARLAQAKARTAAEIANETAHAAAIARREAEAERGVQAQITAQEQARTASGEHVLPESHPSLDFPRSGRTRRIA